MIRALEIVLGICIIGLSLLVEVKSAGQLLPAGNVAIALVGAFLVAAGSRGLE